MNAGYANDSDNDIQQVCEEWTLSDKTVVMGSDLGIPVTCYSATPDVHPVFQNTAFGSVVSHHPNPNGQQMGLIEMHERIGVDVELLLDYDNMTNFLTHKRPFISHFKEVQVDADMKANCVGLCSKEKVMEEDLPQSFTVKLLGRREARGLWGIKNTRDPVDSLIAVAKSRNLSLPVISLKVTKEGIHISPFRPKKELPVKQPPQLICTDYNDNEIVVEEVAKKEQIHKSFFSTFKRLGFNNKKSANIGAMNKVLNTPNSNNNRLEEQPKPEMKILETDFALLDKLKKDSKTWQDRSFIGIDTISYGVQDLVFTRVFSMIVVTEEQGMSPFLCYSFVCEDRHVARSITYSLASAFQIYSRTIKASRPIVQLDKGTVRKPKILAIDLRIPEDRKYQKSTFSEA